MPKEGDRVVVEGTKVGGGRREGTLVGKVGSLIRVRWSDGAESIMAPGAGSVRFLTSRGTAAEAARGGGSSRSTGSRAAASKSGSSRARQAQETASQGKAKTPAKSGKTKKR